VLLYNKQNVNCSADVLYLRLYLRFRVGHGSGNPRVGSGRIWSDRVVEIYWLRGSGRFSQSIEYINLLQFQCLINTFHYL